MAISRILLVLGVFVYELRNYLFGEKLYDKHLDNPVTFSRIWKIDIYITTSIGCLKLQKQKLALALKFIFIKFACFALDSMSMDLFTDW